MDFPGSKPTIGGIDIIPDLDVFQRDLASAQETGVIKGCAVTQLGTPGMGVQVSAGKVRINGAPFVTIGYTGTGDNNTITVPSNASSNVRYDLITANVDGTLNYITGPNQHIAKWASYVAPTLGQAVAAATVPLAMVTVTTSASSITNANITDLRAWLPYSTDRYAQRQSFGTELKRWREKYGNRQNAVCRVWVVGDSWFEGYGQTRNDRRIMNRVREAVQRSFRPGGDGFVPARHGDAVANGVLQLNMLNRWTYVGSPDLTDYGFGLGRRSTHLNASGQSASISFVGDRVQIMYSKGTVGGGMLVTIDGTAAGAVTNTYDGAGNSSGWVWDSLTNGGVTLARGYHTVVVTPNNTLASPANTYNAFLEGAMLYDGDYNRGVLWYDGSHYGNTAYEFAPANYSGAGALWPGLAVNQPPDLLLVEIGANDMANLRDPDVFKTQTQGIVEIIAWTAGSSTPQSYPSVVLCPGHARGDYKGGTIGDAQLPALSNYIDSVNGRFDPQDIGKVVVHASITAGTTITRTVQAPGYSKTSRAYLSANTLNASPLTGQTVVVTSRAAHLTDQDWAPYRKAMYDLAKEQGYAVWDMYDIFGAVYDGAVYDPFGNTVDGAHLTDGGAQAGADDLAVLITNAPVPSLITSPNDYYGDGSDGDLTYDGSTTVLGVAPSSNTYTLNRDILARTITVNTGITINTGGFRLLANVIIVNNGTIQNVGGAGSSGTAVGGGALGPAAATGSLLAAGAGGAGGASSANSSGGAGTARTASVGGSGGVGGKGSGTGSVGAAGTATAPTAANGTWRVASAVFGNVTASGTTLTAGAGGGGGTGTTSGGGGGGGGGGGMLLLAAPTVVCPVGSTLSVAGGIGGNGTAALGGGGGGGGGGIVVIITNSDWMHGTVNVAGGVAGTSSTTPAAANGAAGQFIQLSPA